MCTPLEYPFFIPVIIAHFFSNNTLLFAVSYLHVRSALPCTPVTAGHLSNAYSTVRKGQAVRDLLSSNSSRPNKVGTSEKRDEETELLPQICYFTYFLI
jgi:hypothetical protein